MKKFKVAILIGLSTLALTGCNLNNTFSDVRDVDTAKVWFEDTGIRVRATNNRICRIIKDRNGYLYYFNSDMLTPVLDSEGNITKDLSIFED